MEIEMESDVEKSCSSDLSPNTVLPHRHCSSIEKKKVNAKPLRRDEILRLKEGFAEISFCRYRSSSCKNVRSRPVGVDSNIELKRGSIYQSSREVTKMKKTGTNEGRRKIELSRASESSFSIRIVDSLCSSDEENALKRASVTSMKSNLSQTSVTRPRVEPSPSEGFIELLPELEKREKLSTATVSVRSVLMENQDFGCEQVAGPVNDGNELLKRDTARTFHKSLSPKVEMPHSPPPPTLERDFTSKASSKMQFNPIRKMFDPFMKSKSLRSPLGYVAEPGNIKSFGSENMGRNQTFRKSLLQDFSHTAQKSDFRSQLVQKDDHSAVACSPVHLHGSLKLENKHGVPFFEFSLNCPEEVLVAKTWKANNAFNWVYTFHSVSSRKKSNASQCRLSDSAKESSLLGQMKVSCYLCSELKDGDLENSMVTEFVLYDIAHARNSVSSEDSPDVDKSSIGSNPGSVVSDDIPAAPNQKNQPKHAFLNRNIDLSNPYPCPSAVLHPDLEIAAIIIQFPFSKRESLKCKRGDKPSDKVHSNLLKLSMVEQQKQRIERPYGESPEMVKVVIPTGNHSLPSAENRGPSPLLDRWRLGGGCDCGGWDMACPLTVFGNPDVRYAEDQPLMDRERPLQLFAQGTRGNIPALTLTFVKEGEYEVDFHAQLSTLQAFSICVATLHGTETAGFSGDERKKQLPHCNSLKALIEEEVKFLIEAVTEEEQKKKGPRGVEEIQRSYALNPPFSPIARV